MNETKQKPMGLTKSAGFQVGARKTFPVSIEIAWNFLFSKKGLKIWLGQADPETFDTNKIFETSDGLVCKIKVLKANSHIRLNWKPKHWDNNSTLQIRVIPNKNQTTISFHQEHLENEVQRTEMKNYWKKILDQLSYEFKNE